MSITSIKKVRFNEGVEHPERESKRSSKPDFISELVNNFPGMEINESVVNELPMINNIIKVQEENIRLKKELASFKNDFCYTACLSIDSPANSTTTTKTINITKEVNEFSKENDNRRIMMEDIKNVAIDVMTKLGPEYRFIGIGSGPGIEAAYVDLLDSIMSKIL